MPILVISSGRDLIFGLCLMCSPLGWWCIPVLSVTPLACTWSESGRCAGVPLEADGTAAETIVNTSAIDVLRRLPGVTEGNYRPLMQAAGKFPCIWAMCWC